MISRTFLRKFFNEILNNNFIIESFVNIYYKNKENSSSPIKFDSKKPIETLERKKTIFFQSVTGDKLDCK